MSALLAPTIRALFDDNFATDPSGTANPANWTYATGDAEYIPNALGPTQPGTELQPNLPSVAGGALDLTMQTFNRTSSPPGTSYEGSDVISMLSFDTAPGAGIAFTYVARLGTAVPGMTLGMYTYAATGLNTHSEIDFESLTDYAAPPDNEIQTNIYNNGSDNSTGTPSLAALPSPAQLTQYATYTIEWLPHAVLWFVNGQLERTDTADVPQVAMPVDLDFWGYEGTYASLPPVSSVGANTVYTAEVQSVAVDEIACFAAGTRIATPAGERAVEALAVGDVVLTATGAPRPIVWIGHRRLDCRRHRRRQDVWPVRVSAGAFGDGRPHRRLWLSPDHAVLLDGALIPVRHLVNGRTIAQERRDEIVYWHVELPRHEVLWAEGLACESYLDTGNRGAFDNASGPTSLHPDFALGVWEAKACAPLVLGGPRLAAAKWYMLGRAAALGHAMTNDPRIKMRVDGHAVPVDGDGRRWHVRLPRTAKIVRLTSRVWIPAEMRPDEDDTRRLGVAIARIWLDGREASLESHGLESGWHIPEAGWRWTDGDAELALAGVRELAFEVAMTGTYWQDRESGEVRAA